MADWVFAILAAGLIVGVVMAFVAFIAIIGWRYRDHRASNQTRRRVARLEIAVGLLYVALIPLGVVIGSGYGWVFGVVLGPMFIAMGWSILRDLKREESAQPR
jgi:cbb3-type cytochrome oxidase subunit 3